MHILPLTVKEVEERLLKISMLDSNLTVFEASCDDVDSLIRVNVDYKIQDGSEVKFKSPVDCSQVTGLVIYYPGEQSETLSKEFAFADAHGNNVGDIDHLFAENVVVKVILDVTSGMAFVQNSDTNAYIERTFVKAIEGIKPDATGNVSLDLATYAKAEALDELKNKVGATSVAEQITDAISSYTPDWNAPEGEPGHVLNRTHWKEKGLEEVEVFPETVLTLSYTEGESSSGVVFEGAFLGLEVGKNYKVTWNGSEYSVVGKDYSDKQPNAVGLGNPKAVYSGYEDTGEVFFIFENPDMGIGVYSTEKLTEVTGSISTEREVDIFHQIDPRYIPDMYYSEVGGGSASDTVSFDGNIDGKESLLIDEGMYLVKVSDSYVESSELIGGSITLVGLSEDFPNGTETIIGEFIQDASGIFGVPVYAISDFVYVVSEDVEQEGLILRKGIHFICAPGVGYVSELKATSEVFTGGVETIHHIPSKYIKDMYYTDETGRVLIPENTYTGSDGLAYVIGSAIPITIGNSYIVEFNGEKYNCVAKAPTKTSTLCTAYLGSGSNVWIGGEASDEPFGIGFCESELIAQAGVSAIMNFAESSAVVSVKEDQVVHKIDPKYLPNTSVDETKLYEVLDKQLKVVDSNTDYASHIVCFGNGKFVKFYEGTANGSEPNVWISEDAVNWEATGAHLDYDVKVILHNGTRFVAIADTISYYSEDGITWTQVSLPVNWYDSRVACVGNKKVVALWSKNASETAIVSEDGISWTQVTLPKSVVWNDVTYGDGRFVAAGASNTVIYSDDGVSWTAVEGLSFTIKKLCYGKSMFLAYVSAGKFAVSSDGVNWSLVEGTPFELRKIIYVPWTYLTKSSQYNHFVAISESAIHISRDGFNWISIHRPLRVSAYSNMNNSRLRDICCGNDRLVVLGLIGNSLGSDWIDISWDGYTWYSHSIIQDGVDITANLMKMAPQPDWNQNDPEFLSYIWNRPCYDKEGSLVSGNASTGVLDEVTGLYRKLKAKTGVGVYIDLDKSYRVTYDTTHYYRKFVYLEDEDAYVIGNTDKYLGTGDSGEPFVLKFSPSQTANCYDVDVYSATEEQPSWVVYGSAPVTLPERFLPVTVGKVKSVNGVKPDENGNVQVETSAQPDWNASEGESGYIANRPFYIEGSSTACIESETVVLDVSGMTTLTTSFRPTVGTTYTLIVNGVSMPCVCEQSDGVIWVSNEGFSIEWYEGDDDHGCFTVYTDMEDPSGTYTVSLLEGTVKKLDEKFLPDSVASKALIITLNEHNVANYTCEDVYNHVQSGGTAFLFDGEYYYSLETSNIATAKFVQTNGYNIRYIELDDSGVCEFTELCIPYLTRTTADPGQVLAVSSVDDNDVPIDWEPIDISPPTLYIAGYEDTFIDYTAADIHDHVNHGGNVVFIDTVNHLFCQLVRSEPHEAVFGYTIHGTSGEVIGYTISDEGEVFCTNGKFLSVSNQSLNSTERKKARDNIEAAPAVLMVEATHGHDERDLVLDTPYEDIKAHLLQGGTVICRLSLGVTIDYLYSVAYLRQTIQDTQGCIIFDFKLPDIPPSVMPGAVEGAIWRYALYSDDSISFTYLESVNTKTAVQIIRLGEDDE